MSEDSKTIEPKCWDKEEDLPDSVQAIIFTRHFEDAIKMGFENFTDIARSTMVSRESAEDMLDSLDKNSVFVHVGNLLADELDSGTDFSRMSYETHVDEARDSISKSIIHMAFALWCADGADLPQEIIDIANKVESGEDEEE